MMRCRSIVLAVALAAAPLAASAQMQMSTPAPAATVAPAPTAAPAPSAQESQFLAKIMKDLPARYGTTQQATAAGYFRYSNEDRTGAISWVNPTYWDTTDPDHPAQLWYDVNGRLLGADFSVPRAESSTGAPSRFGTSPSRWITLPAHVHFVVRNADGSYTYGRAVSANAYAQANDNSYSSPTAQGVVKVPASRVTDPASIAHVFLYPSIYDLQVWVVPNPLGQFAGRNPNITPSPRAGRGEDM